MSHILVITFEDENQAPSALKSLRDLEHENLLNLQDAAVIVKDAEGKVDIKNMVESGVKVGAISGGALGLAIGSIMFPVVGTVIGAAAGALVGRSLDNGLDKKFVNDVKESLNPGSSAILFIVNHENIGILISALEPYKGKIYQSSFDSDAEEEVRKALL